MATNLVIKLGAVPFNFADILSHSSLSDRRTCYPLTSIQTSVNLCQYATAHGLAAALTYPNFYLLTPPTYPNQSPYLDSKTIAQLCAATTTIATWLTRTPRHSPAGTFQHPIWHPFMLGTPRRTSCLSSICSKPTPKPSATSATLYSMSMTGFHPLLQIQVSSCILATVSKVFKALFSSRFAVGQAMRAEHQSPSEILIKDSHSDLLLLCKLLHWQKDSGPSSHRQLRDLALIVDKYDCVEAMRHVSYGMLAAIDISDSEWPDEHDMYRLVTAAYLLDQPKHFRHLTRQLVLACGNTLWRSADRDTDLLPSHLLSSTL